VTQYNGIDIIEINRIKDALDRWGERFLRRIYTNDEITRYGKKPQSLAARFACKEAVMKLLGTDRIGVGWKDIETLSLPGGRPVINLYGRARLKADDLKLAEIAVSLSHSRQYAIASVTGASRD